MKISYRAAGVPVTQCYSITRTRKRGMCGKTNSEHSSIVRKQNEGRTIGMAAPLAAAEMLPTIKRSWSYFVANRKSCLNGTCTERKDD